MNDDLRALRENPVVSVEVAGRVLNVSRKQAYELAKSGELPGVFRVGHGHRVASATVLRLLDVDTAAETRAAG